MALADLEGTFMMLYVYRVNEREYGAGFGEKGCKERGTIVEEWPINNADDAKLVAKHGTAYWKASDRVSKIADLVHDLLTADPTFLESTEKERLVLIERERPRRSWLRWFKTLVGESP